MHAPTCSGGAHCPVGAGSVQSGGCGLGCSERRADFVARTLAACWLEDRSRICSSFSFISMLSFLHSVSKSLIRPRKVSVDSTLLDKNDNQLNVFTFFSKYYTVSMLEKVIVGILVMKTQWQQLMLQLELQWLLPSSSSSSPQPAVSLPRPWPPAQPSASSPAGRWSACPSAWPGQHCGA